MRRAIAIVVTTAILPLGGCSRTPVSPYEAYSPPTFGPQDSTFTDDQVRAAVYSTFRWPQAFYHEDGYAVAPYYVTTRSVAPPCCRPLEWRELATEDTVQARAWAESTIARGSNVYPLAPGPPMVSDRYIEFRPAPGTGNPGVAMRIHRMSYLEPGNFRLASDSLVGTFNGRPVEVASVRGLAEYLWFKWNREIVGAKALSSFGSDQGPVVVHVIYETEAVFGDSGICDDLRLYRLEFHVSKSTGEIVLRRLFQRSVSGTCH